MTNLSAIQTLIYDFNTGHLKSLSKEQSIIQMSNIYHFAESSFCHNSLVIIHPRPPKKSVRYNISGFVSSMIPRLPLSFQADTHHKVGSDLKIGRVASKYSKKSSDTSRSSSTMITWLYPILTKVWLRPQP